MEFREFLTVLENYGYLKHIKYPVHWKYEIGSICRNERKHPLLFHQIRNYPGYRLFTGGMTQAKYIAVALGLSPLTNIHELINVVKSRINNPINPVVCESDHKFQVHKGSNNINLYSIAVPWWNKADCGRYIGTWHINVSKNPVNGCRNVGVYRMNVLNEKQTTVSVSSGSHLAAHINEARKCGKDLEMAVGIGVAENIIIAGAAALKKDKDEFASAGGLVQKAVKLFKCHCVDLEMPIESEIILEGMIKCNMHVKDGPFLDYTGIPNVNNNAYLFNVKTIMTRRDPIFRGMAVGRAGSEDHQLFRILANLDLVDFHGSRIKQSVQNIFFKYGQYKFLHLAGKTGNLVRHKKKEYQK